MIFHFGNLGLVIVDEEQKFGVKAKEKLKKMKENVDLLTLTATPIPRTLNLALFGIRDISVIKTAPPNRLPIENMLIDNNKDTIRDVIMKEIGREGQVFYIYNSVNGMEYKVKISKYSSGIYKNRICSWKNGSETDKRNSSSI